MKGGRYKFFLSGSVQGPFNSTLFIGLVQLRWSGSLESIKLVEGKKVIKRSLSLGFCALTVQMFYRKNSSDVNLCV